MLLLIRAILFTITTISNIISRAIFSFIAHLFILLTRVLQVPSESIKLGILEYVAKAIKWTLEFTMEIIIGVLTSLASKMVEISKVVIIQSISYGVGSVAELMEKTKDSLQDALNDVSENLKGLSEMVNAMVSDMWSNWVLALGHVKDKYDH